MHVHAASRLISGYFEVVTCSDSRRVDCPSDCTVPFPSSVGGWWRRGGAVLFSSAVSDLDA